MPLGDSSGVVDFLPLLGYTDTVDVGVKSPWHHTVIWRCHTDQPAADMGIDDEIYGPAGDGCGRRSA